MRVASGPGMEAGTRVAPGVGTEAGPRAAPGRVRILAALGLAAALSLAADHSPYLLLLWGLLAAAALLASWRRQLGLALLGLALGLDLVPWAQQLLPRGQPALFYPPNPLTAVLARETGAASSGSSAGATAGGGAARRGAAPAARAVGEGMLVYPQLLPVYGIAEVRANNVLTPASYLRVLRAAFHFDPSLTNYYSSFDFPDHPLLSFLGVRAVVGNLYLPRPRTLVPLDAPELLPFLVYRNPRALPRWFVPPAVEVIERHALDGWIVRLDDARRVALFRDEVAGLRGNAGIAAEIAGWRAAATPSDLTATQREAAPQASRGAGWPRGAEPRNEVVGLPATPGSGGSQGVVEAQVLVSVPGRVALAVPGGGERLLATSLPGPAGWQASGGGRRLTELTIDGAFLGVLVPAGVTRIELRYLPPGLLIGTALGMLALLAVLALARARRGHGSRRCWSRPPRPEPEGFGGQTNKAARGA